MVAEKLETVPETEQDLVAKEKYIIISEIDVEMPLEPTVEKQPTVEEQPTYSVDLMNKIGRSSVLDEDEPKQIKVK